VGTLRLTAFLIKVILTACFCSQTEDSTLAGKLQRKMSMRDDEQDGAHARPSQAQNDLVSKQIDITNEFKMLTQIFAADETEIATRLLKSVDLADLQNLLQSTLRLILRK